MRKECVEGRKAYNDGQEATRERNSRLVSCVSPSYPKKEKGSGQMPIGPVRERGLGMRLILDIFFSSILLAIFLGSCN